MADYSDIQDLLTFDPGCLEASELTAAFIALADFVCESFAPIGEAPEPVGAVPSTGGTFTGGIEVPDATNSDQAPNLGQVQNLIEDCKMEVEAQIAACKTELETEIADRFAEACQKVDDLRAELVAAGVL